MHAPKSLYAPGLLHQILYPRFIPEICGRARFSWTQKLKDSKTSVSLDPYWLGPWALSPLTLLNEHIHIIRTWIRLKLAAATYVGHGCFTFTPSQLRGLSSFAANFRNTKKHGWKLNSTCAKHDLFTKFQLFIIYLLVLHFGFARFRIKGV